MRKTRAAIMGTNAMPFMMRYWLELFKNWEDEVDKVYISLAALAEPTVENYIRKILKHPKIQVSKEIGGWPEGMEIDCRNAKEDLLLILHDDTFIHKSGFVDGCFKKSEDKVLTPVHSIYSGQNMVEEALRNKYDMPWSFEGEKGYSFLLYLVFIPKEAIMKTSINFHVVGWKKGDYVKELDIVATEDFGGDTGFKLGLELLQANINVQPIKRYTTANLTFEENPLKKFKELEKNKEGVFSAKWVHIQNVANTMPWWFDYQNRTHPINNVTNQDDKQAQENMALKIGLFKEFMGCDDFNEIIDYRNYVKSELKYIANYYGLKENRIEDYKNIWHRLLRG